MQAGESETLRNLNSDTKLKIITQKLKLLDSRLTMYIMFFNSNITLIGFICELFIPGALF